MVLSGVGRCVRLVSRCVEPGWPLSSVAAAVLGLRHAHGVPESCSERAHAGRSRGVNVDL